jgi:hypothetical protein
LYFVKKVKDFKEEDDPLSNDFEKGNIDQKKNKKIREKL